MNKTDEIRNAMIAAMKSGDKERKETLSLLLAALKIKAIDKRDNLTPEEENEIILKEIKQTNETLELTPSNRTDMIMECRNRIQVLEEYAPSRMEADEIKQMIDEVLSVLGIDIPTSKDKGRIMKELMPRLKGLADGKLVNQIVGSLFEN